METKLKEQFLKKIEETNELFNNSTKAEKRVMIAQDCIDRMQCKLIQPAKGTFIVTSLISRVNKELVNNHNCVVCAKGGLFASYIGRVNNFDMLGSLIDNYEKNEAHKKLLEIFTIRQLAIIEFAFEGMQYIHKAEIKSELEDKLEAFYYDYDDCDERLIAICENIIKNKGTFKL